MKALLTLIASAFLLMSNIAGAQEQKAPSAGAEEQEAPSARIIGRDVGEEVGKRIDEIAQNVMGHGRRFAA